MRSTFDQIVTSTFAWSAGNYNEKHKDDERNHHVQQISGCNELWYCVPENYHRTLGRNVVSVIPSVAHSYENNKSNMTTILYLTNAKNIIKIHIQKSLKPADFGLNTLKWMPNLYPIWPWREWYMCQLIRYCYYHVAVHSGKCIWRWQLVWSAVSKMVSLTLRDNKRFLKQSIQTGIYTVKINNILKVHG